MAFDGKELKRKFQRALTFQDKRRKKLFNLCAAFPNVYSFRLAYQTICYQLVSDMVPNLLILYLRLILLL